MRFRSAFLLTLCFNVLILAIDKGGGLLVTWIMRDVPKEKGAYDMITILPILLMTVANQGLATSLVYFTRRGDVDVRTAGETTSTLAMLAGLVVGLLTLLGLWVWHLLDPSAELPSFAYVVPILCTVPLLLITSYRNSIQLVLGRIRAYNFVHLLPSLLFLPAFLLSYFVLSEREPVFAGVLARLFPAVVVVIVIIWLVRDHVGLRPRLDLGFYKRALGYGWRANVNSTLTYLNHRVDIFYVGFFMVLMAGVDRDSAKAQVAFYSLAVTLAELIWYLPDALRDLLFSKVSGLSRREARAITPVVCRNALLLCVVCGGLLFAVHDFGLGLLLGASWERHWASDVTPSFAILLIGTAAFTVAKIVQSDLAARGRINTCIGLGSIVLVSMTVLDVVLVPQYGAVGAAIGSTIAYVLSALASVFVYVRSARVRVSQLLIPQSEDRVHYVELLQGLRARLGSKRHAQKAS